MEIVENSLEQSLDSFLAQPLFCFLGTVSPAGEPRVSPLWYLWEDEQIWIIAGEHRSYTDRVEQTPATALAVVDFAVHEGRVHHVGMRGRAEIVPLDQARVDRLLRRYLGDEKEEWDPDFIDLDPEKWQFIRFSPETVVARDQSFTPSLDR